MLISTELVALSLLLAGIAWLFFSRSQIGRKQAAVMGWLALPFFAVSMTYTWFSISDVDIEIRAIYARYGFLAIGFTHAIILFLLFFINWGADGKRN